MKLAYEDKLEIYRLWKQERWISSTMANKFNITKSHVKYIFHLIDKHDKNKYYSLESKEKRADYLNSDRFRSSI